MSLDLSLVGPTETQACECDRCGHEHERTVVPELFTANITHNLGRMFAEAGVYEILWHGDGLVAGAQVAALEAGLEMMERDPARFRALAAPNGWGRYDNAVPWLRRVVRACREHPDAVLRCSP